MKKIKMLFILLIIFILNSPSVCSAGFYSKPEFRGRIIDAETKQPIEGAVVVALYYKLPMFSGPSGPSPYIFHAKETLTDKKGEFYLPSYSSLTFSRMGTSINFIFYKPGYMAISERGYSSGKDGVSISMEKYFSAGKIGDVLEIEEGTFEEGSYVTWKGILGIVELKRVSPEKAMSPGYISDNYGPNQLPLYYKAIEEDLINRGILKGGEK